MQRGNGERSSSRPAAAAADEARCRQMRTSASSARLSRTLAPTGPRPCTSNCIHDPRCCGCGRSCCGGAWALKNRTHRLAPAARAVKVLFCRRAIVFNKKLLLLRCGRNRYNKRTNELLALGPQLCLDRGDRLGASRKCWPAAAVSASPSRGIACWPPRVCSTPSRCHAASQLGQHDHSCRTDRGAGRTRWVESCASLRVLPRAAAREPRQCCCGLLGLRRLT